MTTAADVVTEARRWVDQIVEVPDGSNHADPVTPWYYGWDAAWCAMFDSFVLAHAGFTADGGETLDVPGLAQTTPKGWAYVPYLWAAFDSAGRTSATPTPGDLFATSGLSHTGIVLEVDGDAVVTAEGNYANACRSNRRRSGSLLGFMLLPYADGPAPTPPPPAAPPAWPGRVLSQPPVMVGPDVLQWQARLAARGWLIATDSAYGPQSDRVTRAFQAGPGSALGLVVDGQVGPLTWAAAWSLPVT